MNRAKSPAAMLALGLVLAAAAPAVAAEPELGPPAPQILIEGYPEDIAQSLRKHERRVNNAAERMNSAPKYLILPVSRRWRPGQTVKVAFSGGTPELHAQIEAAAKTWTGPDGASLDLDFRVGSGAYRTWSPSDGKYTADIRIGFDRPGQWSLVGSDSVDASIKGGAPGHASMNLGAFDQRLPHDWRAVVMHEFGHALGFEHEHQNPDGGCDFRFNDDPGYRLTVDQAGWYTTDAAGHRPGLYTYLGGKANYWKRSEVDWNLRALPTSSVASPFDRTSIMKYFFDPSMFASGVQSACYTTTPNDSLSALDFEGARSVYPRSATAALLSSEQTARVLKELQTIKALTDALRTSATNRINALTD